jgi:hypothetical protein
MAALGAFFIAEIPIAAAAPITVATIDEINAIMSVLINAVMRKSLLNSFIYQSKVNPDHTERDLLALNEKIISMKIGVYKNKKINPI